MNDEYTLQQLFLLDRQYGNGLFSSDLYAMFKDPEGRPFNLYRKTAPDTDTTFETSDHLFWANAMLNRLYHEPSSLFRAHIQWLALNKRDKLGRKEKTAHEKAERYKEFGTLHWGVGNEQLFEMMRRNDKNTRRLMSALRVEPDKFDDPFHPFSPSKESKLDDIFTEAGPDDVEDDGHEEEVDDE